MNESINRWKAAVTAVMAALTNLWGWFGWLVWVWIALVALDYLTGTFGAMRAGEWSSRLAREGCWHKVGSAVAVLATGLMDLGIYVVLDKLPGITPPFNVYLCPVVVVWYILTELGSITENVGAMGAPVPGFLKKAIAALKGKVEKEMDEEKGE